MQGKGDEEKFLKLVEKHQGILHKICFLYCKNKADREDLRQEIILQLWRSFSSFRAESSFSTWMYRVALNTAISMTRKRNLFSFIYMDSEKEALVEMPDGHPEEIKILYKAISHLKKVDKAIVLLWLEEKHYEEIADMLGLSVKNVSVRMVRLKKQLSEDIKHYQ